MILHAASRALADILSPAFRMAFLKTIGLTLVSLVALWAALKEGLEWLLGGRFSAWIGMLPDWASADTWASGAGLAGSILAGLALAVLMAFLIAPVSAVIAGLFLDDAAEAIERRDYPGDVPGRALPLHVAIPMALRFLVVVLLVNLVALVLLLVPGVNLVAFLVANGYLLGREFFDFAAMRQRPIGDARAMRRRNAGTVMTGGLLIAALLAVPVANLLVPLFGAALMVHLHKAVEAREALQMRR